MEDALFLGPKPPLRDFTKAMDPGSTTPSWRSGNNHGFCDTGGHSPIASEPTPSHRLWATAPGATPVRLCEHTMKVPNGSSQPELSTLVETGTFYFGPTLDRFEATRASTVALDVAENARALLTQHREKHGLLGRDNYAQMQPKPIVP